MSKTILAWHFVGAALRDGRPLPADGETLTHAGPLVICESGLHGSRRLIDALQYAPGATICRTRHGGKIIEQDDKLTSSKRTILWRVSGDTLLRDFARACARDVLHLWRAPAVVREWLETGAPALRAAARDAARDAAKAAAWDAARAAARAAAGGAAGAAARDVARDAARAAARDVARDAARAAARAAARDVAWDAQNKRLTAMVRGAHKATIKELEG